MGPLEHYFEVFCPETAEVNARCATQADAANSAREYAKDGREYVVYECRMVFRAPASAAEPKGATP
jgi:hypothetical protein